MDWLWTWSGTYFGYREGDNLWTYDGRHVGRFTGTDVFACDGAYLGELIGDNRLITDRAKLGWRQDGFTPFETRIVYACCADYIGYEMDAGYEDFPAPKALTAKHNRERAARRYRTREQADAAVF
ncbi:hypothetical protein [Paraburkholderia phenoliruptrix]|uniref:Uncharacterized protein n=2 Tax=Paraburkholderia phenoliruptrix TaxID=252970 RepID=K0DUX6_9BURK|nr:hypothetical protein [Paraburkholderia phenoliruptrix]AFT90046.1 hypothetical protein BUPH_04635 [Paraburkholderia phenoliruptrix BR3459a]CAB4052513.1 hypothetical protein LMG9964_06203 [Paraburkholderia phenoliruptrix]